MSSNAKVQTNVEQTGSTRGVQENAEPATFDLHPLLVALIALVITLTASAAFIRTILGWLALRP
jgi:hypothetical protein